MLFRCWCQNDTALKMSVRKQKRPGVVLSLAGLRRSSGEREGGRGRRPRIARRTLPPADRQSATVARVG